MDNHSVKMENIPSNMKPNANAEIENKKTDLEDRSWYIVTILIRIGHPSLPEEISVRCTLFNISPEEVEALCCIPQSPICMTEGHMVTFSEISIFLFYKASHKFVDPLDLVVPDTPVSSYSPPRTCSKGARLYSALQSNSLKNNSNAIQGNYPISSPLFCIDLNRDSTSVIHRKSSCNATRACTCKLDTSIVGAACTCTTTNMLQSVSSTSKGQPATRTDHAKGVDVSLKFSRKRVRGDLPLTNISSRNPPKPSKVARSIFPESFKSIETLAPTKQYCFNPPVEPVNSEVADGAIQGKLDIDNADECHYQRILDYTSACRSTIHHLMRPISSDVPDSSKHKCPVDDSHAKVIRNDVIQLEKRHGVILEHISNNEKDVGVALNTVLKSKSPKIDDCKFHNEIEQHGQESHRLHIHNMLNSNCETKLKLEYAIYHKDDTSKLEEKNNIGDAVQPDGIQKNNLNSISDGGGQQNSLLPMEVLKFPEICEAKEDGSTGHDKWNYVHYLNMTESMNKGFEPNHHVSEISILPVQNPDHLCLQISEPNVRTDNVVGVENDFVCLQGCLPLGDTDLVNKKEFQNDPRLPQKFSEDQNNTRCNSENITKYNDETISIDKEALTLRKNFPSNMLHTSHTKGMAMTQGYLSQKYRNSSNQNTQGHAKAAVIDKGETAGDTISCQKQVEFRHFPIFTLFTVEEEEGSGGYGTVYKARRKLDGQIVAIKCPLEKTPKTSVTNEIMMLQRFGGSNFIIKLEGIVQNNGQDCLILDYVLHDKPEVLRREIIISELQWYGFCLFKALAALHKQGVIHRDVKPGNFLFSRKIKRGYLIDFSLALDQYDTISNKSSVFLYAKRSNRSYMAENGTSYQRSGDGDGSVALRKLSAIGSHNKAGIASRSIVSAYSAKEERKISVKPLATCHESKENVSVPLKHPRQVLSLGSSDIRSHRKFGQDILNTGLKSKLGGMLHSKNNASGRTQSRAEAVREPLPIQGRKELLNLVQEARQNSQQQTASLPVCSRKRVAAPQERMDTDARNSLHVSSMPLNSNLQACPYVLSALQKNTGIQKCKRDGPCVGTKGYRAPEVLLRSLHQGPKLDIWSAGVTLLYFIVGKSPFPASNTDQAIKDIAKMRGVEEVWELSKLHDRQHSLPQDLHSFQFKRMTMKEWCQTHTKRPELLECIPVSLYDLIEKCLCVNPRQRIDSDEALKHEFFAACREEYKKQRASKESILL